MQDLIERAAQVIRTARKTIALTGAGVSAESGIPTFRDPGGLWDRYDPQEYATIEAFQRNPGKVWRMMKDFTELKTALPNPGHFGLAQLEQLGLLHCVITQNVDNLHQAAGSHEVIEFHGNMRQVVCMSCRKVLPLDEVSLERLPPCCGCGGVFKPAGVFFGEPIPPYALSRSQEEAQSCDLILVIGTSAVVYPAADIPRVAKEAGAQVIEINPERTDLTDWLADFIIQEKAGVAIPQIVAAIKAMAS
ncbi:MAG TPA: NAD-dependent deacylase [Candidatus Binatia bacterium]|jgi:NAD-dependent deacetylase|nr:NAD-dependent deacylase [Candidatus Binatia bacterium]